MRLKQYIFKSFFALSMVSLPALWGCHDYTDDVPEGWGQNQLSEEFQVRIKLTDDSRHISRAVPKGGEPGDGYEFGQHHENYVNSVLLYCYKGGLDAPGTTPVRRIIYKDGIAFDPTGSMSTVVVKKEAILKFTYAETHYSYTAGDHFIAVINTPDFNVSTLADLRDRYVNNAWTGTGTDKTAYSDFVMSNERVSTFTPGSGSEADPHKIDVTVERVAARLDFSPDGATPNTFDGDASLDYNVKKGTTDIGIMHLTHVRPFNVMQEPGYLIKRCSTPEGYKKSPKKIDYLIDEDPYNGIDFAKFPIVTEPHTWSKAAGSDYSSWYGESYLPKIRTDFGNEGDDWFTDDYRVHNNTSHDGFTADGISNNATGECINYYVVDYANENTHQAGASTSNTVTGFYLRGVFEPATVYNTAALAVDGTYAAGTTFYRYRPMGTTYDETQAKYFSVESAANDYCAAQTHPGVVETYVNGVCYYPVYLRHDNPGTYTGSTPGLGETNEYKPTPMEFAIVRNNIYRLKVTFSGPGFTTISTTPTIEPLGIKPYIFVRKWYQINHPEIEI